MPKRNFLKWCSRITSSKLLFSSEMVGLAKFQHDFFQLIKVQEWVITQGYNPLLDINLVEKMLCAKSAAYKIETFFEEIVTRRTECAS